MCWRNCSAAIFCHASGSPTRPPRKSAGSPAAGPASSRTVPPSRIGCIRCWPCACCAYGADLFAKAGLAAGLTLDAEGRHLLDSDLRLLAYVETEITNLEKLLIPKAYADPRVKLLMTLARRRLHRRANPARRPGRHRPLSRTATTRPPTSAWCPRPSNRPTAAITGRSPSTATATPAGCWCRAPSTSPSIPARWERFFRRLAKKKNRNVAVVAAARKLVVIAWHLLTKAMNRTAMPNRCRPRPSCNGCASAGDRQRRKTGPTKGSKAGPKLAGGGSRGRPSRWPRSTPRRACRRPGTPPPGEARAVANPPRPITWIP